MPHSVAVQALKKTLSQVLTIKDFPKENLNEIREAIRCEVPGELTFFDKVGRWPNLGEQALFEGIQNEIRSARESRTSQISDRDYHIREGRWESSGYKHQAYIYAIEARIEYLEQVQREFIETGKFPRQKARKEKKV